MDANMKVMIFVLRVYNVNLDVICWAIYYIKITILIINCYTTCA